MFILKENLEIIEKNLDKFYQFEETFVLFTENYGSISNLKNVQQLLITKIINATENQIHL